MRRLVFVTQRIDPDHPVLGAAIPKIRALAERVDDVVVLALAAVPGALPENCRVRTFGAPTQLLRGVRYELVVAPELLRRPAALLAHMSPIYAILAAPLARPLGVRVLLWYVQVRTNPKLERSLRAVDMVLTADARSFPGGGGKIRPVGHGIDVSRFGCAETPGRGRLRLLALGRYSVVKKYPTLLRALRDVDAELVVHGSCETQADHRHRRELGRIVTEMKLTDRVFLRDAVTPAEVPALLADADALVSATRGGADKVVYEACASCRPALAAAPAFADLLPPELRFERSDELVDRLRSLSALAVSERASLGRTLRERIEREHSVEHWADRVLEAAGL
jgi:glycosyltransferase involved in cell wall biosynthesis